MIVFWILAGGLLALALVFVLAPLIQPTPPDDGVEQDALNLEVFRQRLKELDADLRAGTLEQESYDAARRDLERELLYDVGAADGAHPAARERSASTLGRWLLGTPLAILVPVAVVAAYLHLGDPRLADPLQAAADAQAPAGHEGQSGASLEELVQRLEERLKEDPANIDGWLMLGRTYFATNRAEDGLKAVGKAYELAPDRPEIMLAYAEALAAASPSKSLEGKPAELIRAVLEKEPDNSIALWLDGMISFQKGQYQPAVVTWKKVLAGLEPNGDEASNLKQMIAEAETRAGLPVDVRVAAQTPGPGSAMPQSAGSPGTGATPGSGASAAAGQGAALQVEVTLDPAIADEASPDETVFVFARAASGPPMPLAVQRLQVKDLPKTLTLDDSMAMTPAMRLSAFGQVMVGARVSKSGNAMPQSGDLVGETGPLSTSDTTQTAVRIDRVRP